ncbi:MAG: bacillithiol biosynthesis deacetylase BshB1 [Candidatus Xenobiia bacterium LiM19]
MKGTEAMTFDIAAFAAHPDDAEIFCGGTLARMVKKGYRAAIVDMTSGGRGTKGSENLRKEESEQARKVLGVHHREQAGIPDTEVLVTLENRNRLIEILRRLRPRVVITSYWEGRHPDHCNTSRLVYEASYFAGLKNYDADGEPHRPHKIIYAVRHREFTAPSFVADITDEMEQKIESLKCYSSQFGGDDGGMFGPRGESVYDRIRTYASFCGAMIYKKYGEAFYIKEAIEIDDLLQMKVPSL